MKKILLITVLALIATTSNVALAATIKTNSTSGSKKSATITKPVAIGKVMAISGSKITIKTGSSTGYTINLSKAKIEKQTGETKKTIKVKDIKKNNTIAIFGKISGKTITATSAIVDYKEIGKNSGQPGNGNAIMGQITAISANGFTLADFRPGPGSNATTTYSVSVTSSTSYTKDRNTKISKSDLTIGQRVMVEGTINKTAKTITATKVDITTKNNGGGQPPQGTPPEKPTE